MFLPKGLEVGDDFGREKMLRVLEEFKTGVSEQLNGIADEAAGLKGEVSGAGLPSAEQKALASEAEGIAREAKLSQGAILAAIQRLWDKLGGQRRREKAVERQAERARKMIEEQLARICQKAYVGDKKETQRDLGRIGYSFLLSSLGESLDILPHQREVEALRESYLQERQKFFSAASFSTEMQAVNFEYGWNEIARAINAVLRAVANKLAKEERRDEAVAVSLSQLTYESLDLKKSPGESGVFYSESVLQQVFSIVDTPIVGRSAVVLKPDYQAMLAKRPELAFIFEEAADSIYHNKQEVSVSPLRPRGRDDYAALVQHLVERDEAGGWLAKVPWSEPAVRQIPDRLKRAVCAKALEHRYQFLYEHFDLFVPFIEGLTIGGSPAKEILLKRFVRNSLYPGALGRYAEDIHSYEYSANQQEVFRALLACSSVDLNKYLEQLRLGLDKLEKKSPEKKKIYAGYLARILFTNLPVYFRCQAAVEEAFGFSFADLKPVFFALAQNREYVFSYQDLPVCAAYFTEAELNGLCKVDTFGGCQNMSIAEAESFLRSVPLKGEPLERFLESFRGRDYWPKRVPWIKKFYQDFKDTAAMTREDVLRYFETNLSEAGIKECLAALPDSDFEATSFVELSPYISHERLFAIAQFTKLGWSGIMPLQDHFSHEELIAIAKHRPLNELPEYAAMFTEDEIKEIVASKSEDSLRLSGVSLSLLAKYCPHDRLVGVAKRRSLRQVCAAGDLFTPAEKIAIAESSSVGELFAEANSFTPQQLRLFIIKKGDDALAESREAPLSWFVAFLTRDEFLRVAKAMVVGRRGLKEIQDAESLFTADEIKEIVDIRMRSSSSSNVPLAWLASYLEHSRLLLAAKDRQLTDTLEAGDLFTHAETVQIAGDRPIDELVQWAGSFSQEEISGIIAVRPDFELTNKFIGSLASVAPFLPHERLIIAAKSKPLKQTFGLGETFTSAEKIAIAKSRGSDELFSDGLIMPGEVRRDLMDHFVSGSSDQKSVFSRLNNENWSQLLPQCFSGEWIEAKKYCLANGVTEENAIFALCLYVWVPDIEDAPENLRPSIEWLSKMTQTEQAKGLMLQSLKEWRDRLLASAADSGQKLSKQEEGLLYGLRGGDFPHLRVIEQVARFDHHLQDLARVFGDVNDWVMRSQRSLNNKMKNRKIHYSDTEMAAYYEQYLAISQAAFFQTGGDNDVARMFDALAEDKQLYACYQAEILQPLAVLAALSSSSRVEIQQALDLVKSCQEKITANADISAQKGVIHELSQEIKKTINTLVENRLGIKASKIGVEEFKFIFPHLTYLAHIHEPDKAKKDIIGLFAALHLAGQWDKFKQGETAEIDVYLTDDLRARVGPYLEQRAKLDIFSQERASDSPLSVPKEIFARWFRELVAPSEAILTGEARGVLDSIHSIDAMTGDLVDPDNFQEGEEREVWNLVQEFGAREVGKALASRFKQGSAAQGPALESEAFRRLLENVDGDDKKRLPVWQKLAKCFGQMASFVEQAKKADFHNRVADIDSRLAPDKQIIKIFEKIGEEMSSDSGVQPLTEDVEHFESLLRKKQAELSPEEFTQAQNYLQSIKERITELYRVRDELKAAFDTLVRASAQTGEISERLTSRLANFRAVFEKATERAIAYQSAMTGNIADVIQHIRQCLGCQTNECNNDTNLTFGDRNRFLILGRRAGDPETQSRSDELVTVQRTVESGNGGDASGGAKESYSFVMDNVYGDRARDILVANVCAVLQKARKMSRISPGTALDVFVTQAALSSCNVDEEYLGKRLKKEFRGLTVRSAVREVHVAQSASGDGYYEIGGKLSGRVASGAGSISGVVIEFRD